jgi:hypothetical protein
MHIEYFYIRRQNNFLHKHTNIDWTLSGPNDHLQDNMGILHIPYDNNVSTTVPLHPAYNPIKWEIKHVNIQVFITSYPPRKNQATKREVSNRRQ